MSIIIHSSTSIIHLLAALIALITGTYILFTPKGTMTHRLTGRLYAVSMIILLGTAFQMYYLFGRFGIVHWGALGSVAALTVGLGAVGLRTFVGSWLRWHYFGMGTSLAGIYASFLVESTYRFFSPSYFWWATLGPTALVFVLGGFLLYHYYPKWAKQMNNSSSRVPMNRAARMISSTD